MAVASLRETKVALASQIEAAMSVSTVDIQVSSRRISRPTPPTIDMEPADPPSDPDSAAFVDAQGADLVTVRARVNTADDDSNQDILDEFMDAYSELSVAGAILSDPLLSGLARVDIVGSTGLRQYTLDQDPIIGVEWTVRLIRNES